MQILTPLKIAYSALKIHKVRSTLTVLGLLIGVMAIIIVMNLGQGLDGLIMSQMEVFGTDYVEVEIKVPSTAKTSSENAIGVAQGVSITTLKIKDAEAIAKHLNIKDYYVGQLGQEVISYQSENKTSILWGVSASFFDLYKTKVQEGRPFTDEEDLSQARVIVIGQGLQNKLFGKKNNAVNKRIKIKNKNFRVVGVMEEQDNAFYMDLDSSVYIPIHTLQKQIMGIDYISFIIAFMKDSSPAQAVATAEDLTRIMRDQHDITDPKKDDFAVTTMEEAMNMLNQITGGITLLLVAIAGISLLVGGVGIMNIMYVSVSERTYEIGLRKAIGATNSNILWQFLWEAVFLTFVGGLIGVILGSVFSFTLFLIASHFGFDFGFNFSWFGLILAVSFSVIVGLIFGIYPALKASKMEPVEALRHE